MFILECAVPLAFLTRMPLGPPEQTCSALMRPERGFSRGPSRNVVVAAAVTLQHRSAQDQLLTNMGSATRCLPRKKGLHGKQVLKWTAEHTHTQVYIFRVPSCLYCHLFWLMFVCLRSLLVPVFSVLKPGSRFPICMAYSWFVEGSAAADVETFRLPPQTL